MQSNKEDKILMFLTEEDITEGCAVLSEYLNITTEDLAKEKYYKADGLDLTRYLIKHLGGLSFRLPKVSKLRGPYIKYIKARLEEEPRLNIKRLVVETKLDEKTIREYLREIKD